VSAAGERGALSATPSARSRSGRTADPSADGAAVVAAHLAALPEPQRTGLAALDAALARLLPGAERAIAYGMPALTVRTMPVAGYDAWKEHCAYYPHSGAVVAAVVDELPAWAQASKGAIRFPPDRRLPVALLRRLVRLRLDELRSVLTGAMIDARDDGTVRGEGRVRDGRPTGDWRWYRRDGSLMRTGSFRAGEPTGVWRTYAADGRLVSEGPPR
jgi:uncharacterized protein YdhG (YjbR/CyaY superfamily)